MTATVSAIRRNTEKADGVRTVWQIVTPELATKWLEGNTHNRSVRDTVVSRYATDMRAGRWRQTHQGIAFDEDDVLIDGQHRLFAIIEAGIPVLLQVTYGLPLASQDVIDDHIKRSVVDILKIASSEMSDLTPLHAAVARRMRLGLVPRSSGDSGRTRQDEAAFLKLHWDAIHFTCSHFPVSKRVAGVVSASPLAVISRAFYYEDRAALTRFASVLLDGVPKTAGEEVIIVLRNFMLTRKVKSGEDAAREAYGKTARVLRAFTHGEQLVRGHLYAVTEDPYPLPIKNAGDMRRKAL